MSIQQSGDLCERMYIESVLKQIDLCKHFTVSRSNVYIINYIYNLYLVSQLIL